MRDTFAMVAVAIAGMKINLSGSAAVQTAREGLRSCLQFLLQSITMVFLPHMLLSTVVFMLAGYAAYQAVQPLFANLPVVLGLWGILLVLIYGCMAFIYAVFTAGIFSLRTLSLRMEDFIYGLFAAVKERISAKINSMDEGLAKDQAKLLLTDSLTEVITELKNSNLRSSAAVAASVLLGLLGFAAKTVLVGRVMELAGASVSMGAVFASRATLVGAIFLNMSLICTVLLWGLYLLGALIFGGSFWFLYL